ncbi:hypothetical protein C8R42DRAFT_760619 [Lentinula raphanica]|nr:hypothetical protein C8R42DRAFT_760619 [Lentinula raphanica]
MNRLALQVVCIVSAVSTALAAPTLLPPSEALSGLEEPSNAPLHRFQADEFSATGLDVGEPRATTVLVDSVVGSNDLFDKTRPISSGLESSDGLLRQPQADEFSVSGLDVREPRATTILVDSVVGSDDLFDKTRPISSGVESSDGLLRQSQADEFSATGLDVREPQATSLIVDPVTGSNDLFDKTWKLRDDADDVRLSFLARNNLSYDRVNSKLGRRADAYPLKPEDRQPAERQALLNVNYNQFITYWNQAEEYHNQIMSHPQSQRGSHENRLSMQNSLHYGNLALAYLQDAHRYGTYRTYQHRGQLLSEYLPDYAATEAVVTGREQEYNAAMAEFEDRQRQLLRAIRRPNQSNKSKRRKP